MTFMTSKDKDKYVNPDINLSWV